MSIRRGKPGFTESFCDFRSFKKLPEQAQKHEPTVLTTFHSPHEKGRHSALFYYKQNAYIVTHSSFKRRTKVAGSSSCPPSAKSAWSNRIWLQSPNFSLSV